MCFGFHIFGFEEVPLSVYVIWILVKFGLTVNWFHELIESCIVSPFRMVFILGGAFCMELFRLIFLYGMITVFRRSFRYLYHQSYVCSFAKIRPSVLGVSAALCLVGSVMRWKQYYSTGVQIVSCTLSDDSVLSESTGLFNPVLCVSQWNLFWQQNQPIRLCLSNQVRHGRKLFPSPLDDFNRLFEDLIRELFKIWHWNMFYFFKWHQSAPKM